MAGLVEKITVEAAARRKETGSQMFGPAAILAQHPFGQSVKTKRSFAPRVHAFRRKIRKAMTCTADTPLAGLTATSYPTSSGYYGSSSLISPAKYRTGRVAPS